MKQILKVALLSALFLALLSSFFGAVGEGNGDDDADWTIMVYMVGSDLESNPNCQSGSADIGEMLSSVTPGTKLLLLIGGSKKWYCLPKAHGTQLYELENGELMLIQQLDTGGMGSADTLRALVEEGLRVANGGPTALVFWDHGYGPIEGFGDDRIAGNDRRLTLNEIVSAFRAVEGAHFTIIGFDACMMAGCETACLLAPYADYLLASQETEPEEGWNYEFLSGVDLDTDARTFGLLAIDAYNAACDEMGSTSQKQPYTLSLIDLSSVETLVSALDDLFEELTDCINGGELAAVNGKRMNSNGFGRIMLDVEYDLIDVREFASNYLETTNGASAVLDAMDKCVVFSTDDGTDSNTVKNGCAGGLSLYFPCYAGGETLRRWQAGLAELPLPLHWKSFMMGYPGAVASAQRVGGEVSVTRDGDVFSVELTEEEASVFHHLAYFVYRGSLETGYCPLFMAYDDALDGRTASIRYAGKCFMISNGEAEAPLVTIFRQRDERGDHYVSFAAATAWAQDPFAINVYSVSLRFEQASDTGEISYFAAFDEPGAQMMTGKQTSIALDRLSTFQVIYPRRLPPENEEVATPWTRWQSAKYKYSTELDVGHRDMNDDDTSDAKQLTIYESTLPEGEQYFIQIVVVDQYNYQRASEMIPLN